MATGILYLGHESRYNGMPCDRATLPIEPIQELAHAALRQGHARVGRTVVEIDAVAIGIERVPAREGDVAHIALTLVRRFGTENPGVAPYAGSAPAFPGPAARHRGDTDSRPRFCGPRDRASAILAMFRSAAARDRCGWHPTIHRGARAARFVGVGEKESRSVPWDARPRPRPTQLHADILSWSPSQGLFTGLALEGATLRQDLDNNATLYGEKLENRNIVTGGVRAEIRRQADRSA